MNLDLEAFLIFDLTATRQVREAAKKSSSLNAPPPFWCLMAVGTLERWKKGLKKVTLSLMSRPFIPPPTLNSPAIKNDFFCGFP